MIVSPEIQHIWNIPDDYESQGVQSILPEIFEDQALNERLY